MWVRLDSFVEIQSYKGVFKKPMFYYRYNNEQVAYHNAKPAVNVIRKKQGTHSVT